ncbi:hypothetical protein JAAARDRAFT_525436, partial [Jaapia argillacea MUCL 33604]
MTSRALQPMRVGVILARLPVCIQWLNISSRVPSCLTCGSLCMCVPLFACVCLPLHARASLCVYLPLRVPIHSMLPYIRMPTRRIPNISSMQYFMHHPRLINTLRYPSNQLSLVAHHGEEGNPLDREVCLIA